VVARYTFFKQKKGVFPLKFYRVIYKIGKGYFFKYTKQKGYFNGFKHQNRKTLKIVNLLFKKKRSFKNDNRINTILALKNLKKGFI
jgi:hypothetical protein